MTIATRDFIAQVNVGEPQQSGKPAAESRPAPAAVMEAAAKSEYISYPSVGLGRDLRLTGKDIIGAGLVADDQIVHLSVFSRDENEDHGGTINSSYRRRRNML